MYQRFQLALFASLLLVTAAAGQRSVPEARLPQSALARKMASALAAAKVPSVLQEYSAPELILPAIDTQRLREQDASRFALNERRVRAGVMRDMHRSNTELGQWVQVGGKELWALKITSPQAKAIRLHIADLELAPGAELYVFSPQGTQQVARYAASSADVWTPTWTGDSIEIGLVEDQERTGERSRFKLAEVGHFYRMASEAIGTAGACNLDVGCYADWADSSKSVGLVQLSDYPYIYYCSGVLVNNASGDFSPLLLTANHCITSTAIMPSLWVLWNDQHTSCGGPLATEAASVGGGKLLANSANPDFALVELYGWVPQDLTWAAWSNTNPAIGASATGIHHPEADYKRISFGSDILGTTGLQSVRWASGITEPGSSGSPIFDAAHEVTGVLSTGSSSCSNPSGSDNYTRLSAFYPSITTYLENGLPDDSFAPNQTRDTAKTIVAGDYPELVVKVHAEDWVKVHVPAGNRLTVQYGSSKNDYPTGEIYREGSVTPEVQFDGPKPPSIPLNHDIGSVVNTGAAADYFIRTTLLLGTRAYYDLHVRVIAPQLPVVETLAGGGHKDAVQMSGTVNPEGWPTSAWIEWSTDPNLSSLTQSFHNDVGSGFDAVNINDGESVPTGTVVYYRVAASNAIGTVRGEVQSVSPVTLPPDPPVLLAPADGTSNTPQLVDFNWGVVPGVGYEIRLSTADRFEAFPDWPYGVENDPVVIQGSAGTAEANFGFKSLTTYEWNVKASNDIGSTVSPTYHFTTADFGGLLVSPQTVRVVVQPGGTASVVMHFKNRAKQGKVELPPGFVYDGMGPLPQWSIDNKCDTSGNMIGPFDCTATLTFKHTSDTTGPQFIQWLNFDSWTDPEQWQRWSVPLQATVTPLDYPPDVDFSEVLVKSAAVRSIVISNTSAGDVPLGPLTLSGDTRLFTITNSDCAASLPAGGSCSLTVNMNTGGIASARALLNLGESNGTVLLHGMVSDIQLSLTRPVRGSRTTTRQYVVSVATTPEWGPRLAFSCTASGYRCSVTRIGRSEQSADLMITLHPSASSRLGRVMRDSDIAFTVRGAGRERTFELRP